jgi:hypothetical protein
VGPHCTFSHFEAGESVAVTSDFTVCADLPTESLRSTLDEESGSSISPRGLSCILINFGKSNGCTMDGAVRVEAGESSGGVDSFFFNLIGMIPGSYMAPKPAPKVFLLSLKWRESSSGGASASRFNKGSMCAVSLSDLTASGSDPIVVED